MQGFLSHRTQQGNETSERKLRLLACAFCRRIWSLLPDELSRATVELCEYVVDGLADPQPLWARGGLSSVVPEHLYPEGTVEYEAYFAARCVANQMEIITGEPRSAPELAASGASIGAFRANELALLFPVEEEPAHHCHLIRDILGNPFRPITIDPSWLTSTVVALAQQMYDSRDFSAMPILADALQDAGCDNEEILNHCRGEGVHVRGCWLVDLILGKG
jgi:hypothetical protein